MSVSFHARLPKVRPPILNRFREGEECRESRLVAASNGLIAGNSGESRATRKRHCGPAFNCGQKGVTGSFAPA
jgi:hypothetical protein